MTNKKGVFLITGSVLSIVILAILYLIFKSFVFNALLHTGMRLLAVFAALALIQRCFKDQVTHRMKKVLVLCGITLGLDLVVIDAIRFILSGGISTVLFLPSCLPICLLIVMLFSAKDTGKESREKTIALIVGIPLLLLSLYFEIYSFVQI